MQSGCGNFWRLGWLGREESTCHLKRWPILWNFVSRFTVSLLLHAEILINDWLNALGQKTRTISWWKHGMAQGKCTMGDCSHPSCIQTVMTRPVNPEATTGQYFTLFLFDLWIHGVHLHCSRVIANTEQEKILPLKLSHFFHLISSSLI